MTSTSDPRPWPRWARLSLLLVLAVAVQACALRFNFHGGGTVNPDLETLAVEIFSNEAQIIVPYLSQEVTQQIQDRFLSQSRLTLTTGAADIVLSGSITRYTVLPVAISGTDQAAQNRLTIALKVKFENNVEPGDSWDQTFTGFVDFDASEDFSSIERERINEVLEQLTQDIFTKSIGKW